MGKDKTPRVFDFYQLEDRILLSGEGLEGVDAAPDVDADLSASLLAEMSADGQATDNATVAAALMTPVQNGDDHALIDDVADVPIFDPALPIEVVFVDAGVEDAQTLIDGLRDGGQNGTQWFVVELSADEDGIEQITRALSGLSGVDAIHIVSHGDGEGIQLGNTRLDLDSAAAYSGDMASWGHSLYGDADMLIYGCDLASTDAGQDLIEVLARVCDCDVAASDDATGHESLGGDWELEYEFGSVEVGVAFNAHAQSSWQGLLATYTVTNTNDSGTGSLRWAIDQSNASVGITDTIDFNIAGAGVHTISLETELPYLIDDVILDATTQAGGSFDDAFDRTGQEWKLQRH